MKNAFHISTIDKILEDCKTVYIETTSKECFELTKSDNGYLLKDISPPEAVFAISDFKSYKLKEQQFQKMNTQATTRQDGILIFDGIHKGDRFAFSHIGEDEYVVTKGKIDKFYFKEIYGINILKIHLFETPGKKANLADYEENDFFIETQTNRYEFRYDGEGLYLLEDKKYLVYAIYSLFNTKINGLPVDFLEAQSFEYDASMFDFVLNRPFVIIKVTPEQNKVISSFVYEKAIKIDYL